MSADTNSISSHVLIIVENLPVPADRRVWLEATTLHEAGYDVSVICPKGRGYNDSYEVLDGVHIYRHPLKEAESALGYAREYLSALFHEMRLAVKVWRRKRFQIIHMCNPPDLLFLVAGWFRLFHGTQVIFDHHDLSPELYQTKYNRNDVIYQVLRLCEWITFRTAHSVLSTNESYKTIALTRGGKSKSEVTVVRSGPDMRHFQRIARQPSRLGITLGYIGVVAEQDGVELLLEAMRKVLHDANELEINLIIVGDGPSLSRLKRYASDLGIANHVEFTGFLTGTSFIETVSTFDIGVCPDPKNPYNDKCTMNKILEYMALGIPVVQFDLTEGRRSAGEAAIYAQPNEPDSLAEGILALAKDSELRERMGQIGIQRMRSQFSWEYSAIELLAAYRETLAPNQ